MGRRAAGLLLFPVLLHAPAAAQGIDLEVRAGLVISGALVEDLVANPGLIRELGDSFTGAVRAEPAAGLAINVAALTPLRARSTLELSLGWTATRLEAVDAAGRRDMQGLGAAHAAIGVRYRVFRRVDAGCGFGMLRYFASGDLFEEGDDISPLIECATGLRLGPATRSIVIRATGQAHRFRTPILRDAGAQSGSVYRLLIQAGITLGLLR